jgi:hypothetical protein
MAKILGSIFYASDAMSTCIVIVDNGRDHRAYIGARRTTSDEDKEFDEAFVAGFGAEFPLEVAMGLVGLCIPT